MDVMNVAAPISSPTANPSVPSRTATNVEKTSGEPFPNARSVTPAVVSLRPRYADSVARLGQKKSLAVMEMEEKRRARMRRRKARKAGRSAMGVSLNHCSYGMRNSVPREGWWS